MKKLSNFGKAPGHVGLIVKTKDGLKGIIVSEWISTIYDKDGLPERVCEVVLENELAIHKFSEYELEVARE